MTSKKSGIKSIRPPETFRGSRTERARGYCEEKTAKTCWVNARGGCDAF